jgi:hypothetical protein
MSDPRRMRASQTPAEWVRDGAARNAAIRRYAQAHDHFAVIEQQHVGTPEGEGAHRFAVWALRAVRAELDDPEPKERA